MTHLLSGAQPRYGNETMLSGRSWLSRDPVVIAQELPLRVCKRKRETARDIPY